MTYCFHLPSEKSPTFYNIGRHLQKQGWNPTRFRLRSHFNDHYFQFHKAAAEQLEFKHLLAQLVLHYCPQWMPITYCINDQNWPKVLSSIVNSQQADAFPWILKPSLLNNGHHIKIFQSLSELEEHYLNSKRLGGEHVLQKYLSPHLLNNYKYSIRLFVVMTNFSGSFLYPHGYLNISQTSYQEHDFNDLRSHLTNEHLYGQEPNVIQIPTSRIQVFSKFYPSLKTIITDTLNGLQAMHPEAFNLHNQKKLAIFGFDFMIDSVLRPWLLEANHGPCFPANTDHPLQKHLYDDFWQAFIASFIIPISTQQTIGEHQGLRFERL